MRGWRGPVLAAGLAVIVSSQAGAQETALAQAYLAHLVATWEVGAERAQVETLGQLMAPDVVYSHPRVGAEISGREAIVEAMASFLGRTREPRVTGIDIVAGPGVVAIGFDLQAEARGAGGWESLARRQVVILTVVDGQIARIEDHW